MKLTSAATTFALAATLLGGLALGLRAGDLTTRGAAAVLMSASSATLAGSIVSRRLRGRAVDRLRIALRRSAQRRRDGVRPLTAELYALRNRLQRAVVNQSNLESALATARAASESKSSFLANVSHDIRTPMTAILGFSEFVLDHDMPRSEVCDAVRTIRRNGEHMLQLMNDILDLSKVEAGKLSCERIAVAPREILDDLTKLWSPIAQRKSLALSMNVDPATPQHIVSDPTRLRQVLNNLVGNAIKFTSAGRVQIDVRVAAAAGPDSGRLTLAVRDTGPGIRSCDIERIFNPYTQATPSTARTYGGTGLGLCISRRICQALGGALEVSSAPGEGSTFTATIEMGTAADIRAAATTLRKSPPAKRQLVSGRVLLVEDGPDNQRLIRFVLCKAGATVETADNGRAAVRKALDAWRDGHPFDVILMDMQMPEMDGFEATDELRRAGYCGPIIALTAFAMDSDRKRCLDAGCDEFAAKPIQRGELLETLGRYMPTGVRLGGGAPVAAAAGHDEPV